MNEKFKNAKEVSGNANESEINRIRQNLQDNELQDEIPKTDNTEDRTSKSGISKENGENDTQKIDGATTEKEKGTGEEKIRGRGRHVLNCNCEKCVAKRVAKENVSTETTTEKKEEPKKDASDLSAYKKVVATPNPTPQQKSDRIDLTQFISGALFLICIDAVAPSIILTIVGFVSPKYKGVDSKQLRLDADELKRMEPLAEAVVKLIFGSANPIVAFAVTMGLIYTGKVMNLKDSDFKPVPEKKKRR